MESGIERPLAFVDEVTRLPLPILPQAPPGNGGYRSNLHHAFYEKEKFENGTPGQRAVRFSRLQYAPRCYHNRYHMMFSGAAMPETELEEFTLTVLGIAGYIPEQAVDTSGTEPRIVTMNKEQRRRLQLPGILRPESRHGRKAEIGQFLMRYSLAEGLEDDRVVNRTKDEFLHTTDKTQKQKLGFWLVARAIENAVEPINPLYELARRNQALRLGAAPSARLVVKHQVKLHIPDYFETLEEHLAAA